MPPTDLKKHFRRLYEPRRGEFAIVEVPPMRFLMVDGEGDPNTVAAFQQGTQALFGTAFSVKFLLKKIAPSLDFVVPPMEGLWWTDGSCAFDTWDKDAWKWTIMIAQPDSVTEELFQRAIEQVAAKKRLRHLLPRLELFEEGLSIQTLHVGAYSEEGPVIEKMHACLREMGYGPRGKHHEIYLGDPRRTEPGRLRTILRQPIV